MPIARVIRLTPPSGGRQHQASHEQRVPRCMFVARATFVVPPHFAARNLCWATLELDHGSRLRAQLRLLFPVMSARPLHRSPFGHIQRAPEQPPHHVGTRRQPALALALDGPCRATNRSRPTER
jgi:hypothetical protein